MELVATAWICKACGARSASDSLNFPIMHEVANTGHEVEPDMPTALRWAGSLGINYGGSR